MNYPDFLVYIDCITYNHASYIEDAMKGFCMQETTFPFVAAIIDDASTDGEQNVIKRYLEENFDFSEKAVARKWETYDAYFIYAQHKTNKNCYFAVVLLKYNFYQLKKDKTPLISEWRNIAKYVAFCEGDDYWIDSNKLQLQVDYLDLHPDYSLCAHAANYVQNGIILKNDIRSELECDLDMQDLILKGGDYLSTESLVFRYDKNAPVPLFRIIAEVGDYPLVLHMGSIGNVHYFPQIMGVYRYRTPGSWTDRHQSRGNSMYPYFKNEVQWLEEFNKETKYKYNTIIKFRIIYFAKQLMYRGDIDKKTYLSFLKFINVFKLKKEYRKDYLSQIITYKYFKQYLLLCKIKRAISHNN